MLKLKRTEQFLGYWWWAKWGNDYLREKSYDSL